MVRCILSIVKIPAFGSVNRGILPFENGRHQTWVKIGRPKLSKAGRCHYHFLSILPQKTAELVCVGQVLSSAHNIPSVFRTLL